MRTIVFGRVRRKILMYLLIGTCLVYLSLNLSYGNATERIIEDLDLGANLLHEDIKTGKGNVQPDNASSRYDLRIIAMVYDRAESLLRLLNSFNEAEYFNESVKLEVWIDRSNVGKVAEQVIRAALQFKFKHGDYSVHAQSAHVDILGQWLKAWTPDPDSKEIALIVEDDIIVAPLFYRYLKAVHKKYDDYPKINGFALQGFSDILWYNRKPEVNVSYDNQVVLYPIIGCWGFSPSAKNWAGFLKWVQPTIREGKVKPYVPDTITTEWYKIFEKRGTAHTMWEIWHIYYAYLHNETSLFLNLKDNAGFSANMREVGLHYKKTDETGTPSNPLVTAWQPKFDDLPDHPVELNLDSTIKKRKSR